MDIAVIADTSEPRGRRTQRLADDWPHVTVPTDIPVFTPTEWRAWADLANTIPNEAAHEGRVFYARTRLRDALAVET